MAMRAPFIINTAQESQTTAMAAASNVGAAPSPRFRTFAISTASGRGRPCVVVADLSAFTTTAPPCGGSYNQRGLSTRNFIPEALLNF
jgi:hypothetical protein